MPRKSAARGPRHPVIAAYIYSDAPLLHILLKTPQPRDPLVETMLHLRQALGDGREIEQSLAEAEKLSTSGADPELYTLFLGLWSLVCARAGRLAEMAVVLNRAKALVAEKSSQEIRAGLLKCEGALVGAQGNQIRREELFNKALSLLGPSSPRYKAECLEKAEMLAIMGREGEIDTDLERIVQDDYDLSFRGRVAMIRFINCVETGQLDDALYFLAQPEIDQQVIGYYPSRAYAILINLMLSARNTLRPFPANTLLQRFDGGRSIVSPHDTREHLPDWAKVIDLLLSRWSEQALRLARSEDPAHVVTGIGFPALNLIRAELASGNGEAARRLLLLRREKGNVHYLDDLFLGRAELLANNREAAANHFGRALHSIEKHQAHGRLDFELRLATEISPADLLWIGKTAEPVELNPRHPQLVPCAEPSDDHGLQRLVGRSESIAAVREKIVRLASLEAPVLITGETGTGKELIARALHESGRNAAEPFVAINCGAIAESLLESELFGHERGAFTGASGTHRGLFEEAGKGTIFLDEIGEITPRLQVALLRVLESGEIRPVGSSRSRKIRCRIIAATNADLQRLTARGRFRKDLLFRLRRLEIDVPPLKSRPEDILPLAFHFLAEFRRDAPKVAMAPTLKAALLWHEWPGNVRELRNAIERMCLMNMEKSSYDLEDIELPQLDVAPAAPASGGYPSLGEASGAEIISIDRAHEDEKAAALAARVAEADIDGLLRAGTSSRRRRTRLRELFARHKELNRLEISKILGHAPATITRDLRVLIAEGYIEKITPNDSPRTHYFALRESSEIADSP
jgi:DNA-binding NtrC family response regulator